MSYKRYTDSVGATTLVSETQRLHNEMVDIYNEQIRQLQIRNAILEDENKELKKRLVQYENQG